ncbi:MAG: DUF349 domain-containing protein, partial [Bacteroidales bacterium]|nr:DUF349 domain-containing protein [Bacteroidales bacterium]
MNANDNFEKKDLINSNETPTSDATETNALEQNKEANEESKKEQEATLESKETPNIEKSAEVETETKQEEKPVDEAKSSTTEAEPTEDTVEELKDEATTSTEAKEGETEKTPADDSEKADKPKAIKKKAKPSVPLTFEEIVTKLRELAGKDKFSRKELEKVQGLYFSEIRKETEAQKEHFLAEGGAEKDFEIKESKLHTEGKNLLQTLADKRKKFAAEEEKQKETNYQRKLAIIEEVKALTESTEDFNKKFQDVKNLQQEWRSIKLVPHGKEHALWRSYQEQVEKFYDIVHIHNEYRDYDFKKNLESKIGLCEAAEKLIEEDDVVSAFHQLQKLHNDWREIGPVARKDRELIWQRFKEASAEINRRYQARIETLKAQESANYEKKVAICETIEAIDLELLKSPREWEAKTREVLKLQKDWREIGYAPRKVNAKVFRRYRAACDLFFNGKNDFYQSIRGELEENLQKKTELCERAEAMKDSEDWRETTPKM